MSVGEPQMSVSFRAVLMGLPDSLEKPLLILLEDKDWAPAFFVPNEGTWGLGLRIQYPSVHIQSFILGTILTTFPVPGAPLSREPVFDRLQGKRLVSRVEEGIWVMRDIIAS